MLKQKDYIDAINNFTEYLKNETLEKRIAAVYLSGSVGRGDFTPGRSDIDIYIVTNVNDIELVKTLNTKASEITELYLLELRKTCDTPFTLAFTTIDDLKSGNSWLGAGSEYYDFIENSKLLLGKDIKTQMIVPTTEQIKQISKQAIKMLIIGIGEMPEPILDDDNKDYITKGLFEMIFSSMHFMLSNIGIYTRGKKLMVESFLKACINIDLKEIFLYTMNMWNQFETRSFNDLEIKKLIIEGKRFLSIGYNEFFRANIADVL